MSARTLAVSTKLPVLRLILFFILTTCYLLLTATIFAQSNEIPVEASESDIEPVTAKNYTPQAHILYTVMNMGGYTVGCLVDDNPLFGGPCLNMVGQVGPDGKPGAQGAVPVLVNNSIQSGGALGMLGNMMFAMSVTPPTSPVQYLASVGESFGIKPAYAQSGISGSGNSVIEPILKLWQLTRNIAYFGFILIFIAIGFMIMFRQKLNPQTVISAQNALPGVVVALILVTFSYFIAALIIDVGFVATQLTGRLLSANGLANQETINKTLAEKNFLGLYGSFISPPAPGSEGGEGISDIGADADKFGDTAASTLSVLNQGIVGQIITIGSFGAGCYGGAKLLPAGASLIAAPTGIGRIGTFLSNNSGLTSAIGCLGGGGAAAGAVSNGLIFYGIGVLIYVVMIIALVIAMGKTFFELIKAYLSLMIQTIFAPLIIMTGAIPGQGEAFGGWAKTMIANVLVFPAVFAAFFFAAFIMGRPDNTFGIPAGASGDFGITSTVPLLGGLTGEFIKLILVYGILLIIPSIPGEVKKAFKVQDSPLGGVAVGAMAAGYGAGSKLVKTPLQPWIKQGQAWREAKLKQEATDALKPGQEPSWFTKGVSKVLGN